MQGVKRFQDKRLVNQLNEDAQFQKKSAKNQYAITITNDDGHSFNEVYDAPNEAFNAQRNYRSRGWSVSSIGLV